MIEAKADVTVPVTAKEAYAAITDLEHADWLPGVRGLRHIGGPKQGVGARYEVEAGLVGRHLRGVLVCEQAVPSKLVVFPDEGHWILKPQNAQFWYKTFLDWVTMYVK